LSPRQILNGGSLVLLPPTLELHSYLFICSWYATAQLVVEMRYKPEGYGFDS